MSEELQLQQTSPVQTISPAVNDTLNGNLVDIVWRTGIPLKPEVTAGCLRDTVHELGIELGSGSETIVWKDNEDKKRYSLTPQELCQGNKLYYPGSFRAARTAIERAFFLQGAPSSQEIVLKKNILELFSNGVEKKVEEYKDGVFESTTNRQEKLGSTLHKIMATMPDRIVHNSLIKGKLEPEFAQDFWANYIGRVLIAKGYASQGDLQKIVDKIYASSTVQYIQSVIEKRS